ncbi:hypothetical protein R1sor_016178 [Riccia sorocarpa]|uniref:Uncharacterized protein n=1 Tax=Riccia sorocarpa TaxID=122646 RepID=A0ABD3HKF4_9MARC
MLVTPENPTLELLMQRMAEWEHDIESQRKTAEIKAADLQDQLDSARSVQTGVEAKAAERERWERNAARLADFMKQCDELRKALMEKDVQVEELKKRWWETPIGTSTPVHNEWNQAKEELRGFEQKFIDLDSPEMSVGSGGHPIMDPEMVRSARKSLETEWKLRVRIQNDRATPALTTPEEAGPLQTVETRAITPPPGPSQPTLETGGSPSSLKLVAPADVIGEAERQAGEIIGPAMKINTLYPKLKHGVLNLRQRIINVLVEGLQVWDRLTEQNRDLSQRLESTGASLQQSEYQTQSLAAQLEHNRKEIEHLRSTSMTDELMVDYEQTTVTTLQQEIQRLQTENLALQTEIRQRKIAEYKLRREAGPVSTGTNSYLTPSTAAGSEGVGRGRTGQARPTVSGAVNSAEMVEENVMAQTETLPPPPPLPASRARPSTPESRRGSNPSR